MKKLVYLIIICLTLGSCSSGVSVRLEQFNNINYKPKHAQGFAIYSAENLQSHILAVRNPWQGAKGVEKLTYFQHEGEPVPKNFSGQVVKVPAQRIVTLSSSYIAMLDAVESADKVVGVSGIDYISNPLITKDRIEDVGHDTNLDFEKLVALRADVVLLFALNSENTFISNKLKELKIPYIYVGDYVEQSPLGKAEWMIALSELVDKKLVAEQNFLDIEYRYNSLKLSVKDNKTKPRVMLNSPYRDVWFMPSTDSYMVRLINDASGNYVYDKNTGSTSMPITIEQAYTLASGSNIWLNTGWHNNLNELMGENPKFKDNYLVTKGRIFNNNARQSQGGGSDFWESGVVNPDKVLQDLIYIFTDTNLDKLYYYKELK